ncbi:hypothetical protein [Kordiimonas gwangyangensis]|uniref:hypothetical protein n=1 Tax=Kordiimonas gwangyangensis TaxID=288022 RepID=UPI0003776F5A|nr:hypothetical protein [Kordiimonas gwangyangensis]
MAQIIFLLVYIGLAYWVALYGRETRAGFLGTLLLSLVFTPVLGAIFLYAFAPADEEFEDEPAAEPQAEA